MLYAKGPKVISKLENRLGDEQWAAFLRNLYKEFHGKILTYDEFRNCFAKYDKDGGALKLLDSLMTQKGMPGD